MIEAHGLSDVGRVRKGNEDSFACDESLRLFIVADGMGGHNAGEVASRLAVEAMVGFIKRTAGEGEWSWPYGVDPNLSYDANRLRTAIYLANRRVFRAAEDRDDYTGMGTTVVAVIMTETSAVVGHVGDSRVYMYADGELQRLTQDDSWAATVLPQELGNDAAAIARHPMRNVLTNVLGVREQTQIHLAEFPLTKGDEILLLCSDGLHGSLEDENIAAIIKDGTDLPGTARKLIDSALDGGSRDNVTALLIKCPPMTEAATRIAPTPPTET
jgi:serine/threonine protein phosphatase PrpC